MRSLNGKVLGVYKLYGKLWNVHLNKNGISALKTVHETDLLSEYLDPNAKSSFTENAHKDISTKILPGTEIVIHCKNKIVGMDIETNKGILRAQWKGHAMIIVKDGEIMKKLRNNENLISWYKKDFSHILFARVRKPFEISNNKFRSLTDF